MAFYLGKRAQGDLILYEAARPLKRYQRYVFISALGPFLSALGAHYYARCGRRNPALRTPADAERLARTDDTGTWPLIRAQLEAESLLTPDELAAFRLDLACEYEPDRRP
jgi:hypothetical protein